MRFVLLAALSVCAFAQSIPPDAQIQRLLQSQNPRDKAWGAWYAGVSRNAALLTPVLDQLRAAQSYIAAQQGTAEQALVQTLLDAAIQIPGPVPNDVVLPFLTTWMPEVLILLSRRPADAGTEDALLNIRERSISEPEWVAVNDLLYAGGSKSFFQRILQEIHLTHEFFVNDGDGLRGDGGAVICNTPGRTFAKDFPPAGVYQLRTTVASGDIVFASDPMAVYYHRTIIPPDGQIEWTNCQFQPVATERELYLGLLLSPQESEAHLHGYTQVRWHGSAEQVSAEVERGIAEQTAAIHAMVARMKQRGQLPPDRIPLTIKVSVRDYRHDRSVPLRGLGTREITVP